MTWPTFKPNGASMHRNAGQKLFLLAADEIGERVGEARALNPSAWTIKICVV
jgi:hypothetical protein